MNFRQKWTGVMMALILQSTLSFGGDIGVNLLKNLTTVYVYEVAGYPDLKVKIETAIRKDGRLRLTDDFCGNEVSLSINKGISCAGLSLEVYRRATVDLELNQTVNCTVPVYTRGFLICFDASKGDNQIRKTADLLIEGFLNDLSKANSKPFIPPKPEDVVEDDASTQKSKSH